MEKNDSCLMDRLNKLEKTLKDHQANVANRVRVDVEKCLAVSESNHRLIFHQFSKDLVSIITTQHQAMKTQLANVEERLINTKSVQIGVMEARMVVNTQESMMQIGDKVNKLGSDIFKEFSAMKRKMTLLQNLVRVAKKNDNTESSKPVKKKKHLIVKSKEISGKDKRLKSVQLDNINITDEDEVEFLGRISKEEKNISEFDNDFLDLMRDANIEPAAKTVENESSEKEKNMERHDFSIAPMMPVALNADNAGVQDPEIDDSDSAELDISVDMTTEIGCQVKTEVTHVGDIDRTVSDPMKANISDLTHKIIPTITSPNKPNTYTTATPNVSTPIDIRKLPLICPQASSKIMSRKRKSSSAYLETASNFSKTPEKDVTNRLLLAPTKRKIVESFDLESPSLSSSGVSQTFSEKTLVKPEVVSISFSCGFCGEDSFSKEDLEDHMADHHNGHIK